MAPHIPAWRRLGLKLKSEESAAADAKELKSVPSKPNSKKRKLEATANSAEEDASKEARPTQELTRAKKNIVKESNGLAAEKPALDGTSRVSLGRAEPTPPASDSSTLVASSPPLRKSVTFSTDTKTTDGSSNKHLTQGPSTSRLARKGGIDSKDIEAASRELNLITTTSSTATKKRKRRKKAKIQSANDSDESDIDSSDDPSQYHVSKPPASAFSPASKSSTTAAVKLNYLNYLDQYHTSRHAWKFNKNCQTTVLKNIYDLSKIPARYDEALREYIAGLRGDAVRQKLHDEWKEIVSDEGKDDSDSGHEGDNEEEKQAEKRKERVEKMQRAKMVKEGLDQSWNRFPPTKDSKVVVEVPNEDMVRTNEEEKERILSESEDSEKGAVMANGARKKLGRQTKRKRPRKLRSTEEGESSSSDSSSDSSSSSSGTESDSEDSSASSEDSESDSDASAFS